MSDQFMSIDSFQQPRTIVLLNGMEAFVDAQDYESVSAFRWGAATRKRITYAIVTDRKSHGTLMHRLIMNVSPDVLIDHLDNNGLNNVRSNLRMATHVTNARNARSHSDSVSKFKGVSWASNAKKWRATIGFNYKRIHLGYFLTQEEAALAYNFAATELFGEFARLNEIS